MKRVSEVLSALVKSDLEPLSDDAREAIREGLCREQEGIQDGDDEPGLPLGWEAVGPVEP